MTSVETQSCIAFLCVFCFLCKSGFPSIVYMITPMHSNNHLLLEISVISSFSKSYENSCSQIFASLEECLNQSIVLTKNFTMWVPKFIFTITTVEHAIFFSLSQNLGSTTLYTFKQGIKECLAVFPTLYWLSRLGFSPLCEAFM